MQIRIGYELEYFHPAETPMVIMLSVHPSRRENLIVPDAVNLAPVLPVSTYHDQYGNLCTRVVAPAGTIRISADGLVRDDGQPDEIRPDAMQHQIQDLPSDTLVFLLGSRYCETDLLSDFAWQKFGGTAPGWGRVQAICDFVHSRLIFGYQYASTQRTAWGGFNEGHGVCRDFAHLAITLCRCMNIPARYCTGYLGDIGVPASPDPMDFSGWFEVFLGGRWFSFDARHNVPRIGRIPIAYGRDAADVAISTTFGPSRLDKFRVWTDEVRDVRELPAEWRVQQAA